MKKSFRWHLFIRIVFATALIIYANRLLAQLLTTGYLENTIQLNIARTLEQCDEQSGDLQRFLTCATQKNRGEALNSISEYYVLCEAGGTGLSPDQVTQCEQTSAALRQHPVGPEALTNAVQLTRQPVDGTEWLVFALRAEPDGTRLMVRQDDIAHYVRSIWNLRDRILIYVVPVIILMLSLLTLFMTWTVMRPIRLLENSLGQLTSRNLDQPLDLMPSYREFSGFVTGFEQLRQRLNESFLQTRRFAADASHELRTPLTILRGNSERLIAELPTGSDAQVRMRLIGDEIERLIEITEKLLLLSRADANSIRYDMEPVQLSALVTEIALDAVSFQPELQIHTDIAPDITWICDRSLVQQLIHNLYTNAARYNTHPGWIRFSLARQGERFTLQIENPCENIPADLPERAFQRFYRGDAARGREIDGVGLGLSLCNEIARLHKATLSLEVSSRKTVIARLEASMSALTA